MESNSEKIDLRNKLLAKLIEQARDNFLLFVKLIRPDFIIGQIHRDMAQALEDLESGKKLRTMIFMPPRSGKSRITSILYPAWCLGRHPEWMIMMVTHSGSLADEFGWECRSIITNPTFQLIFPGVQLSQDTKAKDVWRTNKGGVYQAVTVGTNIAGKGFHLGILDDTLTEQSAFSEVQRNNIIRWYPGGFASREEPYSRIILTNTRWHENDLAGYLLNAEKEFLENKKVVDEKKRWNVINFPAILNEGSNEEKSYFPERWPLEILVSKREGPECLPSYQWNAVYQQRPTPELGGILKKDYWQLWVDERKLPECEYILLSLDTAFGNSETSDYSAITAWGIFKDEVLTKNKHHIMLLGGKRGRWTYTELKREAIDYVNMYQPDTILIEKRASGQSLIQDLRQSNFPVMEYLPKTREDKVVRAHVAAPIFASKRVWVPDRMWVEPIVSECASFPSGKNDDFVDTVTQAIIFLKAGNWVPPNVEEDIVDEEYYNPRKRKYYNI